MYTIDPGVDGDKHNPAASGFNGLSGFSACNAVTSDYGQKRLLRRREQVHASAFASFAGEPNAITDPIAQSDLSTGRYDSITGLGGQKPGYYRCASSGSSNWLTPPTTLAELLDPANTRAQIPVSVGINPNILNYMTHPYFIGTISTSNCVSRWGVQDPVAPNILDIGNVILSDSFVRTNALTTNPPTYAPVASDFDSGVVYDWGAMALDNITGPSLYAAGNQYPTQSLSGSTVTTTWPRYIGPLGLPLAQNNSIYKLTSELISNSVMGSNSYNGAQNAVVFHFTDTTSLRFLIIEGMAHRFSYGIHPDSGGANSRFHLWCAVEAE